MHKHLHLILKLYLGVLIVVASLFVSTSASFAIILSASPRVVVATATQLPSSACSSTISVQRSVSQVLMKHELCMLDLPALQITGTQVPLSEALTRHEAYVMLPSANASQADLAQTKDQIVALIHAKDEAIRQVEQQQRLRPLIPNDCSADADTQTYQTFTLSVSAFGDQIQETASWIETPDCSNITIASAQVQGITAGVSDYWNDVQYGSRKVEEGCQFIGQNTLSDLHVGMTDSADYKLEFFVSDANPCYFSDYTYTDIPLS